MKKLLGGILISSPFVALFCAYAVRDGLIPTLIVFAGAIFVTGVVGAGAWLLASD